nr:putative ribonuclease H-like domain-containing protein [Tanacetum cinerariifolium]
MMKTFTIVCLHVFSQEETKKVHQALKDPSWIEAMQEELLQFKMQKVWVLVDLPKGKRATGFEDPDYPDKVYEVVKALYGLHQAPRAWYETLANYLLENGFQRENIDQTLFIKKQKGDILLVQVYVDEIIFGSTNKELCKAFEKLMKDKKFGFTDVKSTSTHIDTEKHLLKDPDGEDVDVHIYRLYTNDDWNDVKQLLRMEFRLTLELRESKNKQGK